MIRSLRWLVRNAPPRLAFHLERYSEMASITRCGTCVPPGASKNTAGLPFTVCCNAGNCRRIQWMSSFLTWGTTLVLANMLRTPHCVYKIREHSVSRRLRPGITLADGQLFKDIRFERYQQ